MKKYTPGEIIRSSLILLFLILLLAEIGIYIWRECTKPEPVAGVDYFPFANQHITWTWAGRENQ